MKKLILMLRHGGHLLRIVAESKTFDNVYVGINGGVGKQRQLVTSG